MRLEVEKNCTNCKYIIPVEGTDYGFCICEAHLGLKANEHTFCSEYQEAIDNDLSKCKGCFMHDMITQREDEAYQKGFSDGCDYETKIEELVKINEDLQKQVADLSAKRTRILANKVYSDATLKKWTKADLIEQIRILEHNLAATEEMFSNSVKNSEQIFFEQKTKIEQLQNELNNYKLSNK